MWEQLWKKISGLWSPKQPAATGFKATMAAWTAVVAASGAGLGAAAQRQLQAADSQAQYQAAAGDTDEAIATLAEAHQDARSSLRAQVRTGAKDAERRLAEHTEALDQQAAAGELSDAELADRVAQTTQTYAEHRQRVSEAYLRTFERERLQLRAIRPGLDADGQARVDARLEAIAEEQRAFEDRYFGSEDQPASVDDALALDPTPDAGATAKSGLVDQLGTLAVANPDTVAAQPDTVAVSPGLLAAQPDTVAVSTDPTLTAQADTADPEDEGAPVMNMTLGD